MPNKLLNKLLWRIPGVVIGGGAGIFLFEILEPFLDITDGLGENIAAAGFTGAGALTGAELAELIANSTQSETPPGNPIEGDIWRKLSTNEYFAWKGDDWLPLNVGHQ